MMMIKKMEVEIGRGLYRLFSHPVTQECILKGENAYFGCDGRSLNAINDRIIPVTMLRS